MCWRPLRFHRVRQESFARCAPKWVGMSLAADSRMKPRTPLTSIARSILRAMDSESRNAPVTRRPLAVLIADDEPDTVMTLSALLKDEGHVVQTVTDGAQVMEAVEQFKPEVCILDIALPGVSGYTLAHAISTSQKSDRPVLIAISGKWNSLPDKRVAKKLGFDRFFEKPANPKDVLKVLDQLRGASPLSAPNPRDDNP